MTALKRTYGFLYQWYDTSNGHVIKNPGDMDCATEPTPAQDNCYFLSAVDNGWYASGLMVTRQAFPELHRLASSLLQPMNFSIFYDNRPQTACNVNAAIGNQPTGQMYGGYYVDQGPAGYHNGALYSDPRIAMYLGMGRRQMPGDVWWRTWRTLPPKQCDTDPDFSWQGQWPPRGYWTTIADPQSGKQFRVWEGHYTYPGTSLKFIPTFNGGMFEGLMANDVVPETSWGPRSFGLADRRLARVQMKYATEQLRDLAVQRGRRHRRIQRVRRAGPSVPERAANCFGTVRPIAQHRLLAGREHGDSARVVHRAGCRTEAGVRQHRNPAPALPGQLHLGRRLLRRGEPVHRSGRAPAPRPRPVDDHGGVGQRAQQPADAALVRAGPDLVRGEALSRVGNDVAEVVE